MTPRTMRIRDVEDLCRRKPRQYDTDAELVVRNRANNDLGVDAAQMEGANLLGREGAHERGVLRRIRLGPDCGRAWGGDRATSARANV